jgi:hypothetical protein
MIYLLIFIYLYFIILAISIIYNLYKIKVKTKKIARKDIFRIKYFSFNKNKFRFNL